jgi:hypothetical protein
MKKQLIALTLAAFLGTGQVSAQEKEIITSLPTVTVTSGTVVNKEIDKAFSKAFPGAQNLTWYEINKHYIVKFIENDMKHQALFAKNGKLKYDISYGTEKHLPGIMLTKIQDAYNEYNITRVANVKEAGRSIWVVNLDNLKHFVLVRMEEDEMEEVQKSDKTR